MLKHSFPRSAPMSQKRQGGICAWGRNIESNTEACADARGRIRMALLNSLKRNTRSGSDPDNFEL